MEGWLRSARRESIHAQVGAQTRARAGGRRSAKGAGRRERPKRPLGDGARAPSSSGADAGSCLDSLIAARMGVHDRAPLDHAKTRGSCCNSRDLAANWCHCGSSSSRRPRSRGHRAGGDSELVSASSPTTPTAQRRRWGSRSFFASPAERGALAPVRPAQVSHSPLSPSGGHAALSTGPQMRRCSPSSSLMTSPTSSPRKLDSPVQLASADKKPSLLPLTWMSAT